MSNSEVSSNNRQRPVIEFFETLDLVNYFMDLAPFSTAMKLAKLFRRCRMAVKHVVRSRIIAQLARFLPQPFCEPFLEILETHRALIVGSIPLAVLDPVCNCFWKPRHLEIVVPRGGATQWLEWISGLGYQTPISFSKYGSRSTRYIHDAWLISVTEYERIHVLECTESCSMWAVVNMETTFHMNCISSSRIYCPYSLLTARRLAVAGKLGISVSSAIEAKAWRINLFKSSNYMRGVCGEACGTYVRSMDSAMDDIGTFLWNGAEGTGDSVTAEFLGLSGTSYTWRLGKECTNHRCKWRDYGFS